MTCKCEDGKGWTNFWLFMIYTSAAMITHKLTLILEILEAK